MSYESIERAITVAAQSKADSDYVAFFDLAKSVEFFFNIDEVNGDLIVPWVLVGSMSKAVVFYSSQKSAAHHGKYAGIPWKKGLEMVEKMPSAGGLVIQNDDDYWIAINRGKIEELLNM